MPLSNFYSKFNEDGNHKRDEYLSLEPKFRAALKHWFCLLLLSWDSKFGAENSGIAAILIFSPECILFHSDCFSLCCVRKE